VQDTKVAEVLAESIKTEYAPEPIAISLHESGVIHAVMDYVRSPGSHVQIHVYRCNTARADSTDG
jgi:hypothetical protein